MTLAQIGALADLGRRLTPVPRVRRVRVVDAVTLGPGNRLAVVCFDGRELLLSVTKASVSLIAEQRV